LNSSAELWSVHTPMIEQERRLYNRKTLNPLPSINLSSGNGGVVLDVSEQGLRFRALAPIEESGPIQFSFSAHSDLIAGIADLVWTDPSRKTGGLRFTHLSDDAREQIRRWPYAANLLLSFGEDMSLHIQAAEETLVSRLFGWVHSPWMQRLRSIPQGSEFSDLKRDIGKFFARSTEGSSGGENPSPFKAASAAFVVILILIASYFNHRRLGESLVWLGTKISGEAQPQMITQSRPSNFSTQAPVTSNSAADKLSVSTGQDQAEIEPPKAPTDLTGKEIAPASPAPHEAAPNPRLPKTSSPSKEIVLQVAALSSEADARKMADNLQHENFHAYVRTLPVDSLYRVMLGPYANEESARAAIGKLKKAGFNSFMRRESIVALAGITGNATP
jgi:cell division septation protein DedD